MITFGLMVFYLFGPPVFIYSVIWFWSSDRVSFKDYVGIVNHADPSSLNQILLNPTFYPPTYQNNFFVLVDMLRTLFPADTKTTQSYYLGLTNL